MANFTAKPLLTFAEIPWFLSVAWSLYLFQCSFLLFKGTIICKYLAYLMLHWSSLHPQGLAWKGKHRSVWEIKEWWEETGTTRLPRHLAWHPSARLGRRTQVPSYSWPPARPSGGMPKLSFEFLASLTQVRGKQKTSHCQDAAELLLSPWFASCSWEHSFLTPYDGVCVLNWQHFCPSYKNSWTWHTVLIWV